MRRLQLTVSAFLILHGLPAWAGDPVPDADVTVEQVPGASIVVESYSGGFDSFTLGGKRSFLDGLAPERLPPGWTLVREGRRVRLRAAQPVDGPVRFRLSMGERPKTVDWELSRAGRVLAHADNVVPGQRPLRQVRGSLAGVVVLPEEVEPGEALALRALPGADLPPGRFVLSGVVSEPLEADAGAAAMAGVNKTRSNIKGLVTAPRDGLTVQGDADAGCAELAPIAALLLASEPGDAFLRQVAAKPVRGGERPEGKPQPAAWALSELRGAGGGSSRMLHDPAMGSIRNLKAFYAAAPAGDATGDLAGITIKEKGVELWEVSAPGASPLSLSWSESDEALDPTRAGVRTVSLTGTPTADGCRFTSREPDLWDLARAQAARPKGERPAGKPDPPAAGEPGPVQAVRVPESLAPGAALSLQYVDAFGDLVLDVPAVPGTQVVPPREEEAAAPPCLSAATAYAQAGDRVCVCGHFPTPAAWAAVELDELPAGEPLTASASTLWFALPGRAAGVGLHTWSGDRGAGFAASCRAHTQVIAIGGEIDSQRLLRGETTPMRLTISGTADPVPLRLRNLTPTIISIEGGEAQTIESSGGGANTITRSVRGLTRGNFNVEWTLATPACPCGEK